MSLTQEQLTEIDEWEIEFDKMDRGRPDSIVAIDFEKFDVMLTEGGLYNLFLMLDVGDDDDSDDESMLDELLIDIQHKFPNKMTFLTARSMAEFLVINILPYLEGEINPYGQVNLIP